MNVIWTNGCFDILHRGHIELFKYAKSLGDMLIVGIDEDNRVKESKGEHRPINCLEDRKFVLQSIEYIDEVVSFGTDHELEEYIKFYNVAKMVIGSDYKHKNVIGSQFAKDVVFFDRIANYSTTNIESKL